MTYGLGSGAGVGPLAAAAAAAAGAGASQGAAAAKSTSPVATVGKITLIDTHEVSGKTFTESATRANTIDMAIRGLETKIKKLNEKITSANENIKKLEDGIKEREKPIDAPPIDEDPKTAQGGSNDSLQKKDLEDIDQTNQEIKLLTKELSKAQLNLEKCKMLKDSGATWGSTNTPRFAFIHLGRALAKKMYAPILCNLWVHEVKTGTGDKADTSTITRSAAISDFSHGEISLKELKDLQTSLSLKNQKEADGTGLQDTTAHSKEIKTFYKRDDTAELVFEFKVKALVGYGADKLIAEAPSKELNTILEKLSKEKSITKGLQKLKPAERAILEKAQIDESKLNDVVEDRQNTLRLLALQDLEMQLEAKPAEGSTLTYGRTALVDLNKGARKESGCVLQERTMALDMKAIFDDLQGKNICFDLIADTDGPYFDEKGQIHMPLKYFSPTPNTSTEGEAPPGDNEAAPTITLNTFFFNTSAQGGDKATRNRGIQKEINDQMMAKLEAPPFNYTKDQLKDLQKELENLTNIPNYDPNTVAVAITQFMESMGGRCGLNCYGGKDRTGGTVACNVAMTIAKKLLKPETLAAGETGEASKSAKAQELKKVISEIGLNILSTKGIAGEIGALNAGDPNRILKLSRWNFSLYNLGTIKGVLTRIAHGANGVILAVSSIFRKLFGGESFTTSSDNNQAYLNIKNLEGRVKK